MLYRALIESYLYFVYLARVFQREGYGAGRHGSTQELREPRDSAVLSSRLPQMGSTHALTEL